jgi:hypothetical protein
MKIENMIVKDHDQFRELIEELRNTTVDDGDRRMRLFSDLRTRMRAHSKAEENVFLMPLSNIVNTRPVALVALEEHAVLSHIMRSVLETSVDDATWGPKITVLAGVLKYHLLREENELLPVFGELFTPEQREEAERVFEQRSAEVVRTLPSL